MFNRLPTHPTCLPPAPGPRLSRCFATTADGRIPLSLDWPRLFHHLGRVPRVALQTRHGRARLIALGPFPVGDTREGEFHRLDCRLRFHYAQWSNIWARLALCDCCGSPGRIEIVNTHGTEFMQICAAPDLPPAEWAGLISDLAERPAAHLPPWQEQPTTRHVLPRLPATARNLSVRPGALVPLLELIAADRQPVTACLHTTEAFHLRLFMPSSVQDDGRVLTAGDRRVTLQLAHLDTARLHLEQTSHGLWLHVADEGSAILLTLGPGDAHGPARATWDQTLSRLFNV